MAVKTRRGRGTAETKSKKARSRSSARPAKARAKTVSKKRKAPAVSQTGLVEQALATFAHEVRTPLTGILAITSLLATSDLDERERRWVDTIMAGAEHLAALATLFVDAAKGASGSQLRQDFFDLRALARAAGDSLAGRAVASGLEASVDIADALPAFVIGDAVRLRAALENLIDNAVKFTPSGQVKLAVDAASTKGQIVVSFAVSDSGIGISLAEIKRLFRPFSQANVSIASRYGGAGLGLWSVKQLARNMGGDVKVSSRQDGGTTFVLTVKVAPATAGGSQVDAAAAAASEGLRILSVEDNPFGRVVLNTVLTELGHRTEFIGRGELAPERIVNGDFDVVLMDMVLPGIDGIEAIRRIRNLDAPHGGIGIVGVSGRDKDEARSRAAGANAFLVKPVSPRALATALLEATGRVAIAPA